MKQKISEMKAFWAAVMYCIKLSINASPFYTCVRIFVQLITVTINLVIAYMGKVLIDALTVGSSKHTLNVIFIILAGIYLMEILSSILQSIKEYCTAMHEDILRSHIELKMMDVAKEAEMSFFDSAKFYDAFETVRIDAYDLSYIIWNIIDLGSYLLTLISTFIIVSQFNFLYGMLVVIATVPTAIVKRQYAKKLYEWDVEHISSQRKMGYINEVLTHKSYAADIRLYHIGDLLKEKYYKVWRNYFTKRRSLNKKRTVWSAVLSCAPHLAAFIIIFTVTSNIIKGVNTIGDYTLYAGILTQLISSILAVIDSGAVVYENKLKVNNIKKFAKSQNKLIDGKLDVKGEGISLEFKNVYFQYPGTHQMVLENISFKIENGEKVAVVGVNGAGKSTLIKLILRFYDVTSGEILVNGINIKKYKIEALRKCFSTFFQQYVIFAFSLRDNINMCREKQTSLDDEKIMAALQLSQAKSIYEQLPKGLDTYLTKAFQEEGVELSGGQMQKIALARAFYRESPMIIMDEPTSALDPEAEFKMFEEMKQLCENKTTFFTSHRLSNIAYAERIIVIEHGKIIEQGSHTQLMQNAARYAQLYKYQSDKFNDLEA